MSIMQSEFDPKVIDRMIAEESEKLMKNHSDVLLEQEFMKQMKKMNIKDQNLTSARISEEQKKALMAIGRDIGSIFPLDKFHHF